MLEFTAISSEFTVIDIIRRNVARVRPEFEGAKDKREPNRRRRLGTIE